MTSATEHPWRTPIQDRSRRRFDEILAAAAAELDDVGYQRLSLDAVAKRAGSAVGSVYRYFPSKQSLVAALLDSYNQRFADVYRDAYLADDDPLEDVVVQVSERYEQLVRTTPGMTAIAAASLVDRDARHLFRAGMAPQEEGLDAALGRRYPDLGPRRRTTATAVLTRLMESLMTLAATGGAPSRDDVVAEMRVLVRGYAAELEGGDG